MQGETQTWDEICQILPLPHSEMQESADYQKYFLQIAKY